MMMSSYFTKQRFKHMMKTTFSLLFLLAPSFALAIQVLPATENNPLPANISKKEMSRLSVEGGRIQAARFIEDELTVDEDKVNGVLFMRPKDGVNKKINIFITSAQGKTYLLVLNPVSGVAENIVINELDTKSKSAQNLPEVKVQFSIEGYERSILTMMMILHEGGNNPNFTKNFVGEEVSLWEEAIMTKDYVLRGLGLKGEAYTIRNSSRQDLKMAEQEFYRKGVFAVSLSKHTLAPGESTLVYIVSDAGGL